MKVLILCVLVTSFTQTAQAKSVYAIINHVEDIIGAYKIDGNQIEYQTEIQAPQHATRAIDLAIDSDSHCIFVTYEYSNIIEIMNAKTLENEGSVTAAGASNLAGIFFDEARQKLYVVDRGTDDLFVYLWNSTTKTLTPDGTNPKTLSELSSNGAYGIALDTNNSHLYVTDYTSTIHYYDTNDWSHVDSLDVGEIAVDVDIDSDGGYLYAGGYTAHDYLLKLNLSTGIDEANDIGEGVIGLAVDPDSGLVYTTTYHNQLRVYDTSTSPFTQTDYEDISAGCGVCVPIGDVSYKPPRFYFDKVDIDAPNFVLPEDYITYMFTYGPNGVGDTNVVITDYLPSEVNYSSSDGDYNDVLRTVTWEIGTLYADDPNDSNSLTVQVKELSELQQGIIANYCEIESDQYCSFDTVVTDVNSPIIYVDVNADGSNSGLSWYHADPSLQSALEKVELWNANQIWVAEGTYQPVIYGSGFQLINAVPMYGGFPSGGGKRNRLEHETILDGNNDVQYVVVAGNVDEATILDGFTIKRVSNSGILIDIFR